MTHKTNQQKGEGMSVQIRKEVTRPDYLRKIIDKNMQKSITKMANDIYVKAKELEPSEEMKKNFFERVRDRLK